MSDLIEREAAIAAVTAMRGTLVTWAVDLAEAIGALRSLPAAVRVVDVEWAADLLHVGVHDLRTNGADCDECRSRAQRILDAGYSGRCVSVDTLRAAARVLTVHEEHELADALLAAVEGR